MSGKGKRFEHKVIYMCFCKGKMQKRLFPAMGKAAYVLNRINIILQVTLRNLWTGLCQKAIIQLSKLL